MPQFEIKQEESKTIAKATFDNKEDYMVITLKGDDKQHIVHILHGKALIAKKVATEVKDAKLDTREVETTVIKEPKVK